MKKMLKFCKHVKFVSELHELQNEADKEGASAIGISSQGNLYFYNKEKKSAEKIDAEKAAELLGNNISEIKEAVNNIDGITVSAAKDKVTENKTEVVSALAAQSKNTKATGSEECTAAETKFTGSEAANLKINELFDKITEDLNLLKAAVRNK